MRKTLLIIIPAVIFIFSLSGCQPKVKIALQRGEGAIPFAIMQKDIFAKVDYEIVYFEDEEKSNMLEDKDLLLMEGDPIFLQENFSKNVDMMGLWSLPSNYGLILGKGKSKDDFSKQFIAVEGNGISSYLLDIWQIDSSPNIKLIYSNQKRYKALEDYKGYNKPDTDNDKKKEKDEDKVEEQIAAAVLSHNYLQKAINNGMAEIKSTNNSNMALLVSLKPIKASLYKKLLKDYKKGLQRFSNNSIRYKDLYKEVVGYSISENFNINKEIFYNEDLFNRLSFLYKMKNPVANLAPYNELILSFSKKKNKNKKES